MRVEILSKEIEFAVRNCEERWNRLSEAMYNLTLFGAKHPKYEQRSLEEEAKYQRRYRVLAEEAVSCFYDAEEAIKEATKTIADEHGDPKYNRDLSNREYIMYFLETWGSQPQETEEEEEDKPTIGGTFNW